MNEKMRDKGPMGRMLQSLWTLRTMKLNLAMNGDLMSVQWLRDNGMPEDADETFIHYTQAVDDAIEALSIHLKQMQ